MKPTDAASPATLATPETGTGLDRATARVLWFALVLAFLHHADHVLRVDHSGWPFRERVTPFTYSLAAYPVILFALLGPAKLFWARFALLAGAAAFTLHAHTAIESPATQYVVWAHGTSAHEPGVGNALGVTSPVLGALAVVLSLALNATAVAGTLLMLRQGLRRRRRHRTP